jgi:hypothetical protein
VIATTTIGIASLVRRKMIPNPTLRLMIGFAPVAMALHVGSLFLAYLGGGFEDWMIESASSFPRYTTQVGYAACATGLVAGATVAIPWLVRFLAAIPPKAAAAACSIGALMLFATTIVRPTLALEPIVEERMYHRQLAVAALEHVPPGHRVVAAAPKWAINYLRYVAWTHFEPHERPSLVDGLMFFKSDDDCDASRVLSRWLANRSIDVVLLIDAHEYTRRCARHFAPDQIWRRILGYWQPIDLPRDDTP